ncbi:hypothetical protein PR003_g30330 [Phytophthora rubi]|uniref:DDE-1 domain-containing protein n=1 Tax=Phytophthora rubi TaxID=129364 RepID=A0A6A4BG49_9STRA|nr:hypothetical protein PR003_g30330 [Phytophthora rubi]
MPATPRSSKQRSYTIQQKRDALLLASDIGTKPVADSLGYPPRTVQDWAAQRDAIFDFKGAQVSKTLKGQGRKEIIPFAHGLLTFMKDMRRDEEPLCTTLMLEYIKTNHRRWFNNYMSGKKSLISADNAIQVAQHTKKLSADLEETHLKFAVEFWEKHESSFTESTIFNVDKTAIYYDTPPKHILAERGRKGSAKVKYTEKHSARLTAVLTFRADGKKLPILFIVKGMPGGSIEKEELPKYPQGQGHVYCVQENGWMDSRVWSIYAKELLKFQIDVPSVLLADNFDCHVSEEGQEVIKTQTYATVCPLRANSTAVCQPLDVGVMGPLKKTLRALWLTDYRKGYVTASEKRLISVKRTIRAWALIDS